MGTNSLDMTDNNQKSTEEVGFKVFVGNLSFQTNNDGLKDFFGAAGKVLDANIITRGTRSLGYGFVTFENQKDANACVAQFDKKELDGRTINVENATARDPSKPKPARTNAAKPRRGRGRGRGNFGGNQGTRTPRESEPKNEEPSKTTLFVANLPFKFKDADLSQLFAAHKPVKAHVIIRRNGMSKGFGFVEFASEADQQKAMSLNDVECEGRKLIVKVALGAEHKTEEDAN